MDYKKYEVRVYANGNKEWYLNNKLHREDGPAIECVDGTKCWYLNGKLHQENGPAVKWTNGTKFWYIKDELHREDGPACEYADGRKEWYLNGEKLTEQEFLAKTVTCHGKVVEIDGKKYKLVEV